MANTSVTIDELLKRVEELEKRKFELTVDTLYLAPDIEFRDTVTLSKPYTDYSFILVACGFAGYDYIDTSLISVKHIGNYGTRFISDNWDERIYFRFTSETTLNVETHETSGGSSQTNNQVIYVIGIK